MAERETNTFARVILVVIIVVFAGAVFFAQYVNSKRAEEATNRTQPPTKYTNYVYEVSLSYPSDWQPTPGYNYDHYEGPSGFFALAAAGGATTTLDQLTKQESSQSKLYGSLPVVETTQAGGQSARLIMPSSDQPTAARNQAALIITYPKSVVIGSSVYKYLIIWSDTDHIRAIGDSLKFVSP